MRGLNWIGLALLVVRSAACAQSSPPAGQRLPNEVYVWQRAWTAPVRESLAQHAVAFSNLVVLGAEVSWKQSQPQLVRVPLDFDLLLSAHRPIGLALRIGPFPGPFAADDTTANFLASLAASLVAEAKAKGLTPAELQLDFDCAAAKLDGYRIWITTLRKRTAPIPVTITTLPSWLTQPAFRALVNATDGYVLQVHSLRRPNDFDSTFALCDPEAAQTAVARANSFGVAFRVALPTYGYIMAFAPDGRFVGLSAEGPAKSWPENARLREVCADPLAMARLVQFWNTNSPASLRGIIWYRLPVADDSLNWRWPTLNAILNARAPQRHLSAGSRRVEPGLAEISLVNDGELDVSSRLTVEAHWTDARVVAGDGLRGFELVEGTASGVAFQGPFPTYRLPAGETRIIGWLRLNNDREVHVELKER